MSGFPGPPGYSEFVAAESRRDREEARSEAQYPAVERSADEWTIHDIIAARINATNENRTKAVLIRCGEYITKLEETVRRLEQMARGNDQQQG